MNPLQQARSAIEGIQIVPLLHSALIVIILAQIVAWHYMRFADVLSNKRKFAGILVALALTTLLVITVIKNSVALSLGLVGALSIVRFRTPIKEAEELMYLFLAIGIGLGIGGEQRWPTIIIVAALLVYLGIYKGLRGPSRPTRTLIQISLPNAGGASSGSAELQKIVEAAEAHTENVDLRRVDVHGTDLNASLLVDARGTDAAGKLLDTIKEALPGASVSLVDREILD